MADSSYAPQSPDLSSFLSGSPNKPAQTSSYVPRSPNLNAFTANANANANASAAAQPPPAANYLQGFGTSDRGYQQNTAYYPQIPDLPASHSFDALPAQQQQPFFPAPPAYQQAQHAAYQSQSQYPPQNTSYLGPPQGLYQFQPVIPQEVHSHAPDSFYSHLAQAPPLDDMSGRVKRERKPNSSSFNEIPVAAPSSLGPSQGIEIRTKFPVARIKRIMQADEEVGKVAQVTPVVVSKALELFMISLVTKSAELAKAGSSKRVTAQHLKRAIQADSQFDFLDDIVGKVVEGPDAGGKKVKGESDSDSEGAPKKKARGGRKKKGAD